MKPWTSTEHVTGVPQWELQVGRFALIITKKQTVYQSDLWVGSTRQRFVVQATLEEAKEAGLAMLPDLVRLAVVGKELVK